MDQIEFGAQKAILGLVFERRGVGALRWRSRLGLGRLDSNAEFLEAESLVCGERSSGAAQHAEDEVAKCGGVDARVHRPRMSGEEREGRSKKGVRCRGWRGCP